MAAVATQDLELRELMQHFDIVKGQRGTWNNLWAEVSDHGLGRRTFNQEVPYVGRGKRTREIYDNTMMVANELLASGLHNLLTSTAVRWVDVSIEDERYMQIGAVLDWCATAEDHLFTMIERPEAGFHPAMYEVYNDIAAFGNGALLTLNDREKKGLLFEALPLVELYPEEDHHRRIVGLWREFQLSAHAAVIAFGENAVPEAQRELTNDPTTRHTFVQAIRPTNDPRVRNPFKFAYRSVTYEPQYKRRIKTEGFREMPIAYGRWNRDSGEIYARGPGVMALSEARMLNSMNKTTLRAAQKVTDPPILIPHQGMMGQLQTGPNGLNVYMAGTQDPVRELYPRGSVSPDIGVEMIDRHRTSVRAAYHYDLLSIIQDPRMSATQVLEISSRTQQILSPLVGRLQVELLDPSTRRMFNIELRSGRMPPVPEILRGQAIKMRFKSPVQRAQRTVEANAAMKAAAELQQLAQSNPEAMDTINFDRLGRFLFLATGTPPELLRDEREVIQLRESRAALAREQQNLADQAADSERTAKVAPAILKLLQGGGGGSRAEAA
jgi:hypothetical protein